MVGPSSVAASAPRHFGQRDVHGRQHDAQRVASRTSSRRRRAGQVREQIGMAAPWKPGQRERLLVDGRRRDRIDRAARRVVDRAHDGSYAARPASALSAPGGERLADGRRRVDERLADVEHARIGRRAVGRDLRPDTRGVADRDARSRPAVSRCWHAAAVRRMPQPPVPQPDRVVAAALARRSRRAPRLSRWAARSAGSTSAGRTGPDSFDGLSARSCCLAILIDTGSNDCSNVVQQSGRPHDAVAAEHLRLVADADLPHLDARAELGRQLPHQLAEIDAAFGREIEDEPSSRRTPARRA